MDRAMVRGRAAMIAAMVCGACAGPPQSERAREAPSVQPRPAQSSSITGRAEQRLPRVDTTRVPTRALVLGRHEVQLAQHSEVEHVERLFDGDVSTAPTMAVGATVRLRVGAGVISSLRVFGAIDGWVELRSLQRGQWQRVEIDLRAIPRAADRWRTIAIPTAATSSEIELKFSDTAVASAPSEIEAWGRVEEQPPSRWLAERLVNSTAGFERISGRGNARRVSTLDLDREPEAGRFVLSRAADALPCRRAFLRYSLDGAAHWTHVTKTLNGASLGPASASRPGFGGIQIEEVPASLVRAGDNELRFGVVRPLDPAGYLASDVELLCATSGLASIADVERPASALIDGDATSAVTGTTATASRALTWDFGGRAQAHTVSFRLDAPSEGALELTADGARTVQRIPLSGRQIGWHDFELPDAWPASGAVTVRVALPSEGLGSISEVRIGASPVASEDHARLVITWPHAGECVDGRMHVRGFVTGAAATANWTVSAGTRTSALDANSGFSLTDVAVSVDSADEIEIRATTDEDQRLSQWIPVSRCESTAPRSVAGAQDQGAPLSVWAEPSRDAVLAGGGLRVEIPRGAVSSSTRVTARPLAAASVREMDSGMANVTAGRGAWRLGPSPMRFLHHVKISLPFDRAALPAGKTERDVQLFYFDEASRRWNAVSSEAHDGVVTARTDHFTDWVAATVTNPDSPESSASDGQSVGALGAGHPLAGVHGASAPAVNAQGTATTSFPIIVPPGRHGMQPSISLSYDSSSGGSIVGHGWSLGLPSIAIDTRFGVPTHNGGETYLLNGAALVWVERLSSAGGETRDRFEPRVLTSGLRVVRVQTGAVVTWEVTDPSGTVSYFGTDASARLSAPAGASAPSLPASTEPSDRLYTTSTERTGVWHLSRVIDNFGNTIQYNYLKETGNLDQAEPSEPSEPWVAIAPSSIVYTGHVSGVPAAHFEVHFESDTTRADVAVSARFGFVARSARRITAINVSAGGALVRRYQLDYRVGDFGKTLLQRVIVRGSDGISELFRNEFDYHTAQRDSGNNLGFVRAQQWSATAAPYALEAGYGNGGGANVFAGVGDPAFFVNIGAGIGVDGSSADNNVASTDVNGDGLIDFINRDGNVRYNSFAATGGVIDRTAGVLLNQNLPLQIPMPFLWEDAVSLGGRVGVSLFTGRGALGATVGGTWNSNSSMFLDVDGDGRPDIVNGTTQEEGHPVLSVRLNPVQMSRGAFGVPQPGGSINRDYRIGGLQLIETQRTIDLPPDLAGGQQFYRTAPLVRWTSQIQGKVRLRGVIERVGSGGDGVDLQVFIARGFARVPAGMPEWSTTLGGGTCTPSGTNGCDGSAPPEFTVSAGDRIYFLVKPKNNIDGDTVFWNPRLEVVESYGCPSQIQGDLVFCVPNAPPGTYFDRAADFRLADRDIVGFTASSAGTVEINATFASSTPVVAKLYRRRRVSATPPPVITASGLTAAELTALFSATLEPTVTEIHSWPAMAGGTLFLNGVGVDERDELIVHFLLPTGTDPSTISNFAGTVRYLSVVEGGLSYTIGSCAPPAGLPSSAPPVPQAAWACALSGTTASGRTSIPQALVVSTIDSPAVAWFVPSRHSSSTIDRADSMFGFYRGWSYAEWNSDVAFSDEGVANPFQQTYTELIEAVTASPRRPVLPPRMLPMLPKPAGSRFVLGADDGVHGTVLADLSVPLWRGSGIDSFITATTLKPSSRSVFFIDATGRVLRTTSVGASATDAPGLRAGYSMSTGVNISASVGPVGGSASLTSLRSNNDLDFFDFNGDGLPDSVRWTATGGTVQIQLPRTASNPDGAFSPPIPVRFPNMRPGLRQSNTSLDVGGFGFATAGQTWTARSGGNGVQFSA